MYLKEIWRYPVKSMKGERLESANLTPLGIEGDRLVQVRATSGKILTARTRPALLGHRGTTAADGQILVDGRLWSSASVIPDIEAAAGSGATLTLDDSPSRFDVLPLLVATDGAISVFGADGRRLRPNLVIGGVPGLAERAWEGRTLRIGSALIRAEDLRQRCIMTTFDPDTLQQDTAILRRIHQQFDGSMALNCRVLEPAAITVGDAVELLG